LRQAINCQLSQSAAFDQLQAQRKASEERLNDHCEKEKRGASLIRCIQHPLSRPFVHPGAYFTGTADDDDERR